MMPAAKVSLCSVTQLPLSANKAALVYARLWRAYAKAAKRHLYFDRNHPSELQLDLVTPVAEKDLNVFRQCVEKVHEHLLHPIGTHYLVGANSALMHEVCRDSGCTFVDENEVCPGGVAWCRKSVREKGGCFNRPSWLFQQLCKLNMDSYCSSGRFLTLDADTVFLRPLRYELGGRVILDVSDGYRSDFDTFLGRMLPGERRSPFSYMCHVMLMENRWLREMKAHLSDLTGLPWREAIMELIDYNVHDCFSEFELYANFVLNRDLGRFTRSYWFNRELPRERIEELPALIAAYSQKKKTLSMHVHVRGDKV